MQNLSDHATLSEATGRHLVYFAAERTLLVWISTSLGLMGLGFVVDRFGLVVRNDSLSTASGTALVLLGALMSMTAAVRYGKFARDYHRAGDPKPGYGILVGVMFAVVVAALAVALAVALTSSVCAGSC